MPGVNCSVFGCGSCRRTEGIGIFKLPAAKNEEYKKWIEAWLSVITKTRTVDKAFKKQIENDSVYTCEKHFLAKDIESSALVWMVCDGAIPINIYNVTDHLVQVVDQTKNKSGLATLIFGGDISLDKPIRTDTGSACAYNGLLAHMAKYFREVDYSMINLESPFVTREMANETFFPTKGIHNKAWPEGIEALTSCGVSGATIANNHLGDYGGDAAILTSNILKEHSIDVIGLTHNYQPPYTSQVPLIKEINGIKIGVLAYCGDATGECVTFRPTIKAGPALLIKETVEEDIKLLRPRVDVLVLFVHWGKEYMSIPEEDEREIAISLTKLGVDLIVGSHPHVLQGHEWINDTLVHYSLGNFVFHPHFTFMGSLRGKKNKTAIHEKYMELSKKSRGPASYTELFKVELTKTGVKEGYYLPVRVHMDNVTECLYPKAEIEDNWLQICGPEDKNCYVPRPGEPIYP